MKNLRIETVSDREVLHFLNDVADEEGFASTAMIVDKIGLDNEHAANCVGVRLGFLRKNECVVRERREWVDVDGRTHSEMMWSLTDRGRDFMSGVLAFSEMSLIDRIPEEKLVDLTSALTRKVRQSSGLAQFLTRRELRYGLHKERVPTPR